MHLWQIEIAGVYSGSVPDLLAKSPAHRVNAQSNHIFASIIKVFKMEYLKSKKKMNYFALKSKFYLKAIRSAFDELQKLQAA